MKVKELVERLSKMPQDYDVIHYESGSVYDRPVVTVHVGNSKYHIKNNIKEVIIRT